MEMNEISARDERAQADSGRPVPALSAGCGHVASVDDDPEILALLERHLERDGYRVTTFASATEALKALWGRDGQPGAVKPDLVISDWKMPEMSGIEFVDRMKEVRPDVPIIMATAYASIEGAIEAMRKGAFDYIVKPVRLKELRLILERAMRFRKLEEDNRVLRQEIKRSWSLGEMIGKSPAMRTVFDLVLRVSQAPANVLINGESGTGKEMVARAVHFNGPRRDKPFVAINCAAIPETLLESELFGHAKGSFTGAVQQRRGLFEEAQGGTIFLDEIGDMPGSLQVKLLRVIQERKIKRLGENVFQDVDIRIIAATHKDLRAEIKAGRFREDLFYRLSVIPILIPPLRERKEDIPLLAEHFVAKYGAASGSRVTGLSKAALGKLMSLRWEGNVRELQNVIERAVILCNGALLEEGDIVTHASPGDDAGAADDRSLEAMSLREMERIHIRRVLELTRGQREQAARTLGIDRKTLYRKIIEYGIQVAGQEPVAKGFDV
jgi:two-component system, NtrC family, response regulator AtoC